MLEYKPLDVKQQRALDFWIFSYLCNGMNFTDILHLKRDDLDDAFIHLIPTKTKRTRKKDLRPIKVGLNPRAVEIIRKRKNRDDNTPYLFPILNVGLSETTIKYRCQRFIKWVNKHMEAIRLAIRIKNKVGTYVARHTFSSVLKRKNISTEFIKEALGHSSVFTTENYRDSFSDQFKMENANLFDRL